MSDNLNSFLEEGEFDEHGLKTGLWKLYLSDRKTLSSTFCYLHGVFQGLWKSYYPNGDVRYIGNHKMGKNEGLWIKYHENKKIEFLTFWL